MKAVIEQAGSAKCYANTQQCQQCLVVLDGTPVAMVVALEEKVDKISSSSCREKEKEHQRMDGKKKCVCVCVYTFLLTHLEPPQNHDHSCELSSSH